MSVIDPEGLPKDEPVGQLGPEPWLSAPATKTVLAALTADGAEIRFVGGCVRDSVLHRPVHDVDIATHDPPERVMILLERAGIRAIPTGIDHGTVTAVIPGPDGNTHFEITTLRRDVETDGRHARVSFDADWTTDAARRDFTINALFCTPDGRIYDPFGGLADLGSGRIRFVGDAMKRVDEDALRILRYFRIYAHYGSPPPDIAALAACRAQATKLATLSGERIANELLRLLEAHDPASVLLVMQGERVLEQILPEAQEFGRLRMLTFLDTRGILRPRIGMDRLRRLAALLPANRAAAENVARRLKLSGAQAGRLVAMAAPDELPDPAGGVAKARRLLYRIGAEPMIDLVLLAWAGKRAVEAKRAGDSDRWIELLDTALAWHPVSLPVSGSDVLALGFAPGPRVGEALAEVERWWIDGDFKAGRDEALARLAKSVMR
jgi:poly(A) polymerase